RDGRGAHHRARPSGGVAHEPGSRRSSAHASTRERMTRRDTRMSILGFLAITLLALGALLVFARYPAVFRTGVEYRTTFRNVGGLNRGTAVRFGGIAVGMVTGLQLDTANPAHILVEFRVKRTTPVRTDTRAAIGQVGLLGEPFLDLRAGRAGAPT